MKTRIRIEFKTELCKCNKCGNIMYDENPQIGAKKHNVMEFECEILPMELLNDEGDSYWGCGDCETDEYLTDF